MTRHHHHIGLFTLAISVTLFVYALYGYMHYSITTSLDRVISGRSTIAEQELVLSQESNLTAVYEKTIDDRAQLASFFVADSATVSFIETVEGLGTRTGGTVTLSSIEADNLENVDPGTVGHIKAHVEVRGSWTAVMKTLKLAENLPYGVDISAVRVDTSSGLDAKARAGREWRATFIIDALLVHKAI